MQMRRGEIDLQEEEGAPDVCVGFAEGKIGGVAVRGSPRPREDGRMRIGSGMLEV